MRIDDEGNMELSAEENQSLMDQLKIHPRDYDDPPVRFEFAPSEDGATRFKAINTRTGHSVVLVFDPLDDDDND
jgi:hypothetical protein